MDVLYSHTRTHTGTQKHVIENLDFLSSSLISVFRLKAPAVSACYGTLNTSHEPYVSVCVSVCVGLCFHQFLCERSVNSVSSYPQSFSLALPVFPSEESTAHSNMRPFWISRRDQRNRKTHPFPHLRPFLLMTVILTTMSPVFQVFAHSSLLWFSVDLPGQRSQSVWSMSLPAVLNSKRNDPRFLFLLSSLIAFSQWRENVR